jgi:hypothetical protein
MYVLCCEETEDVDDHVVVYVYVCFCYEEGDEQESYVGVCVCVRSMYVLLRVGERGGV